MNIHSLSEDKERCQENLILNENAEQFFESIVFKPFGGIGKRANEGKKDEGFRYG